MFFDIRMINSSGIGTYIKALLPAISENYAPTFITDDANNINCYHPYHIYTFTSPVYSIAEQLKYCLLPHADILFSPHYNVPILPVRAKVRIATIHDVYHLANSSKLTTLQKVYAKLVMNRAVNLSDHLITVSEFSKSEIIKYTGCPENKITVIHNGVKQTAEYLDQEVINLKYSLPEKYILYVGNVKPHKNLSVLLNAYKILGDNLRNSYKIVIAGKKEGFITGDDGIAELINTSPELRDNVVFTGYVDEQDIDNVYKGAALFVFPSIYEGFGLPPLEAMLNECPVISSNAASLPEVCGDAAIYFDPMNSIELASKITGILTNTALKQDMVLKGKNRIRRFTWERSIKKHLELFNNSNASPQHFG